MRTKRLLVALVLATMLLGACAPAIAPAATQAPAATEAPSAPAAPAATVAATEAPTAAAAVSSGKFVWGMTQEPDTLDPHKTTMVASEYIMQFIGGSLIAKDPDGKYVGYLAESWTASADSLVWEFKLRKDVKFQDGTPLTAKDFVYTYQRAVDPKTASPAAGGMLDPMKTIEAVDDFTLKMTLKAPYYPILESLSDPGYMMPLEQKSVEALGDKFGHTLVGVGPYKIKEWNTGQSVVLEVNPDYKWAPAYSKNPGPYKIQEIEFRIIPEYATIVAGLQSGEINFAVIDAKDVQLIKDTGNFDVLEGLQQGLRPYIILNMEHKPFDDVRVRQAFNYAMDRQTMAKFVVQGFAVDQKGPLTPSQTGYSSEMDTLGYTFDLEKAKALLADAGYKPGADGIMAKDGVPLKFKLETLPVESWVKAAEVAKDMFKALGVDMEIEQLDPGVLLPKDQKGDFDVSFMGMTYSNEDMLYLMFHSSQIGGMNFTRVKDPALDKLLEQTRTEIDPAKEQAAVNASAKFVADNALVVFLYTPTNFSAISNNVQGYVYSPKTLLLYMEDASIK